MEDAEGLLPVVWVEEPPGKEKPYTPIWSPKPKLPVRAVVVCEAWVGCLVHWSGYRTLGHTEPSRDCVHCRRRLPTKLMYYVGCYTFQYGRRVILAVTPGGMRACKELRELQHHLRGQELLLTRAGDAPESRMLARLELPLQKRELPPPYDLRAELCHVFFHGPNLEVS